MRKVKRGIYLLRRQYVQFSHVQIENLGKPSVSFTPIEEETGIHVFNLAFGDLDETTQKFNDLAVTDNKDTLKVLATVAYIVLEFTTNYPNAIIYATGSSESRNRLYQIAIKKHWYEIDSMYDVFGEIKNGAFMKFIPGINFIGFVVMKKNVLL